MRFILYFLIKKIYIYVFMIIFITFFIDFQRVRLKRRILLFYKIKSENKFFALLEISSINRLWRLPK